MDEAAQSTGTDRQQQETRLRPQKNLTPTDQIDCGWARIGGDAGHQLQQKIEKNEAEHNEVNPEKQNGERRGDAVGIAISTTGLICVGVVFDGRWIGWLNRRGGAFSHRNTLSIAELPRGNW